MGRGRQLQDLTAWGTGIWAPASGHRHWGHRHWGHRHRGTGIGAPASGHRHWDQSYSLID
ncbi:hypothetical protein [Kamptonema formosum]|uniref:hypothetical protein n=1 Tax=Kamptonema formosum TaxID=331992 RepID=UPI0012DE3069|nr:hypothetical protein [Oscillatoria sp. PCC 10802]